MAGKFSDRLDGCEATVEVSRPDPETLKIAYTFENRTDQEAYLFNIVYKDYVEGRYETDPNLVYVELNDKSAVLSKKIIKVPDDIDVEKPAIPCVTKVAPGGKFSETITLKLPLKAFTPYLNEPPVKKDEPAREAAPVERDPTFELGFFLTRDGGSLAKEVETGQGKALYFYPFTYANQKVLKVGPIGEKISIVPTRKR